jgi:hypothetical protein
MSLRTSLIIDGDASGAKRAAQETTRAIGAVVQQSEQLSSLQQRINAVTGIGGPDTARRAADIAAYGKGLDDLRAKFDPLFAAERQHAEYIQKANAAFKVGAIDQDVLGAAVARENEAFKAQIIAIRNAGAGHAQLSTQAMALQHSLRSMAEGIAMGIPPSQMLGMQLNHLSYAASGPGGLSGAVKEVGKALLGVVNPTIIAAAGIAAVTTGAIAAYASWKEFALGLDDVAKQAGLASRELATLQAAASFKGISQGDFQAGLKQFSASVYQAQLGAGTLAELFRANNVQAKGTEQSLARVADLIQHAASDQQRLVLLQQAGLPATMDWVRLLEAGSAGLQRARDQAIAFGGTFNDELVGRARKFDEEWNKAWTNFGLSFKSGTVEVGAFFDKYGTWIDRLGSLVAAANPAVFAGRAASTLFGVIGANANTSKPAPQSLFTDRTSITLDAMHSAIGAAGPTRDPAQIKQDLANDQQRISLLGELATVDEQVRAKQDAINLARLAGVGISRQQEGAILALARAQAEENAATAKAQLGVLTTDELRRVSALQLEAAAVQKLIRTDEDRAAALTAIQKRNEDLIKSSQIAAAPLPDLKRLEIESSSLRGQLDRAGSDISSSFGSAFADFATGSKKAGDAFRDMVTSIERSSVQLVANLLFTATVAKLLQAALGVLVPGAGASGAGVFKAGAPIGVSLGGLAAPALGPLPLRASVAPPVRLPAGAAGAAGGSASPDVKLAVHNVPEGSTVDKGRVGVDHNGDLMVELVYRTVDRGFSTGRFDKSSLLRFGSRPTTVRR